MTSVDTQEWQGRVGKSWAAEWQRTDRSFAALTSELLSRIADLDFSTVLDIGCGAGELSVEVARTRADAEVLGLDISPDLIDVAKARGAGLDNLTFDLADAASWRSEKGFRPDLLMSRHGVMFFSDPIGAFAHLRQQSARRARVLFSCFRHVSENPFFGSVGSLVEDAVPSPDPHAPGPFAFADAERVRGILSSAGWSDIELEPFDFRMIAGAGDDPVSDAVAYFSRIGPAARAISLMDDDVRASFKEKLFGFSQSHLAEGTVGLDAGVWIVSAKCDSVP